MSLIGNVDTPASYVADYMQACVGMFGIPAGGFVSDIETFGASTGYDVESLYAAMLNSSIGRSNYAPGISNESFATKLVDKVGGGLLSDADKAAAIDEVQALLDGGLSQAATAMAVVEFVAGLETSDETYGAVAQQFANRIEIANYYTFSSTAPSTTLSTLTAILSSVDNETDVSDPAAVLEENTDPAVSTGQTYTLTKSVDVGSSVTGTNGNDTFVGVDDSTDTNDTINTGDSLIGGAGTDTFNIVLGDATADAAAITLAGIEVVKFTGAEASGAYDATNWGGPTTIHVSGLGANGSDTDTVTVNNLTANATVKLENVGVAASNNDAISLTWADGKAGGSSSTLNLDVNNVGKTSATAVIADIKVGTSSDVFTTVAIAATGSNNIALEGAAAGDVVLSTINVSGTGSVTFAGSTNVSFANVSTVNASSNSGGVTIDLSASTKNATVTGGSGSDTFTVDLATNITVAGGAGDDVIAIEAGTGTTANLSSTTGAADSISGGDGTDVLSMVSADADALDGDTAADLAVLSGFERVRISNDLANNINISKFGVNYLQVGDDVSDAGAGTTMTVSGFSSGATVELRDAANMTDILAIGITGADASTTDELNVKLNADLTANDTQYTYKLDVDGINIVNINAADRGTSTNPDTDTSGANVGIEGYVVDLGGNSNDDVLKTVTITGDKYVSYTESATATALGTVDGSAATGKLVISAAAHGGTEGVTIKGGSNNDTLTGGAKTDTISGGAGNDTIDGNAGADILSGGDGADIFDTDVADSAVAADGSGIDKISDYTGNAAETSADKIRLAAGDNVKAGGGTAVQGVSIAVDANGKATFASATDTMTEIVTDLVAGTAANEVVFFEFSGNTYVYSSGAAGDGSNDVMVQLTGVTGQTKITESTGTAGDFWLQ